MGLIHCIYASTATRTLSFDEIEALLRGARANNASLGLSGMLLHVDGSFFQVLEGEAERVDTIYRRIAIDPRHERVTVIIREPITRRAFADWNMGFAQSDVDQIEQLLGTNDFFTDGTCLHTLSPGRAKKLLSAFASGRWRSASPRNPQVQTSNAP